MSKELSLQRADEDAEKSFFKPFVTICGGYGAKAISERDDSVASDMRMISNKEGTCVVKLSNSMQCIGMNPLEASASDSSLGFSAQCKSFFKPGELSVEMLDERRKHSSKLLLNGPSGVRLDELMIKCELSDVISSMDGEGGTLGGLL